MNVRVEYKYKYWGEDHEWIEYRHSAISDSDEVRAHIASDWDKQARYRFLDPETGRILEEGHYDPEERLWVVVGDRYAETIEPREGESLSEFLERKQAAAAEI